MHCTRPRDYHSLSLTRIQYHPPKVTPLINLNDGGEWMIFHFSIVQVHFVFCWLNFIVLFPLFYKILQYYICYYCILARLGHHDVFFCASFTSFHTLASLLTFFVLLCLISFLQFLCTSAWENTRPWVPYFLEPYWMVLAFFRQCNYKCTLYIWSEKLEIVVH